MSLKTLHIIFITASCLLAFGFGVWMLVESRSPGGGTRELIYGIGSLAVGIALIVYGRYFLKKLKDQSYL
jgi:NhaP-type Na+/H+ or K+/H+ antiporter